MVIVVVDMPVDVIVNMLFRIVVEFIIVGYMWIVIFSMMNVFIAVFNITIAAAKAERDNYDQDILRKRSICRLSVFRRVMIHSETLVPV